jgi:release factor glutamine methyltransferase
MTWSEYYRYYLQQLQHIYNAEEASIITALVFENKAGLKRLDIVKSPNEVVKSQQKEELDAALHSLLQHMPVQHITGQAWFYNLNFAVNKHVLIPRPETEELVQWIINEHAAQKEHFSILDIGSGSGCIAVALKKNLSQASVTSLDMSKDALAVAKQNAIANNTAVDFLQLDFLNTGEWQRLPVFDIIVSNPPYIPLQEKEKLDRNVTAYEPHHALFVPDNNLLVFYTAIAAFAAAHLKTQGKIYVEVHEDYAKETAAVFATHFSQVIIKKDINGKERMVMAANFLP